MTTKTRRLTTKSLLYKTKFGALHLGRTEDLLAGSMLDRLKGKVQLIFTSPPFPLNEKKKYGNLRGEAYLEWIASFAPLFHDLLRPRGSIVIELGNAWEPGRPTQSLLPMRSLLEFLRRGPFVLCQEVVYYNPARLPTPAQWVTIKRIRLKDSTTRLWWMSKVDNPKADNRRVLRPYSKSMKQLLERGAYNSGRRPSEHIISPSGFLADNGGAISPNMIQVSNTGSASGYQSFCREHRIAPHPARMPIEVARFFIEFLTDNGDLVLDPFAGSNTTGLAAEELERHWISIEADQTYACSSVARFEPGDARKLLRRLVG